MSAVALDQVELVAQLDAIAKRIRRHHDEALAAGHVFQSASEEMRASILLCGQALLEAKSLLPHGRWIPWVKEKCSFSQRTARRYMEAAQPNRTELADLAGKVKRFTYRILSRWAQRTPAIDAVLAWPIEEQRRALADLEPTEKLCAAIRLRIADASAALTQVSDGLTPANSAVRPPYKESLTSA